MRKEHPCAETCPKLPRKPTLGPKACAKVLGGGRQRENKCVLGDLAVLQFSFGVLAVLDQSGLLGLICTCLGCRQVCLGQTPAVV